EKDIEKEVEAVTSNISKKLGEIFPGYQVRLQPDVAKVDPDKAIGAGSKLSVAGNGHEFLPVGRHGTGLRRTLFWASLDALVHAGQVKKGKKKLESGTPRILLIEEPESFLHPPTVRASREALYSLASLENWQVIVTTHSPIFVDVSKSHTTIVRVARDDGHESKIFSTDRADFSDDEKENLKMIRACNPSVTEFFFSAYVVLVEGEAEQAVFTSILS